MAYVFAFRIKNSNDRDVIAYIDTENANICGCAYYGNFFKDVSYNDVETILIEEQYGDLITRNFEHYTKEEIINALQTKEAKEFAINIKFDEINFICNNYNIDRADCIDMIDYYKDTNNPIFFDRGMIACIWDDKEEMAKDEMWSCGYLNNVPDFIEDCIDYEAIADKLIADSDMYYELSDERIVLFNI